MAPLHCTVSAAAAPVTPLGDPGLSSFVGEELSKTDHLCHPGELGRSLGRRAAILAGDENMDLGADRGRRAQRLGGRILDMRLLLSCSATRRIGISKEFLLRFSACRPARRPSRP
jgi:hypothetical protein